VALIAAVKEMLPAKGARFGPPTMEETTEGGEYSAEWQVEGAVIKIVFFEQDGLKLHFTVKQNP
jgi:hypothetical protein